MGKGGTCRAGAGLLVLWCACCVGCSRPGSGDPAVAQAARPVPFRAGQAITPADSTLDIPDQPSTSVGGVPFREPQSLPAGTLISVRLKDSISSGMLPEETVFAAQVDEPVVVAGTTMISQGAEASGRIEAARAPGPNKQGYLRLTLDSVEVGGHEQPIQTSSLFVHGKPEDSVSTGGARSGAVTLGPGRRLTFRLSEPFYLASQTASSAH
jgi:hypothetical protein